MNVLAIGAHPDDIELSCGATLARHVDGGDNVFIFHTTTGEYYDLAGNLVRTFEENKRITIKSAKILGIPKENIIWWKYPDGNLKFNSETVSKCQKIFVSNEVDTVYTHNSLDTYHQDHIATHKIVMASSRRRVNNIILFENVFSFANSFMTPNYFVDIKDYINKKFEAIKLHRTEFKKYQKEKWLEQIRGLALIRGLQANIELAEAFKIVRYVL